jgi:hypothetical protein
VGRRAANPSPLDPAAAKRFWDGVAESSRFFMGHADVQKALAKLVTALETLGIPYAIVGAMALNEFGHRRVTVDVDVLLTPEGLAAFKEAHLGRGYVEKFPGSRGLRDAEFGVNIDVVLTGHYPGDGKPKPIAFPDPAVVAQRGARLALLPLPRFVELKLASGISASHRLRDLADIQDLIRSASLPKDLASELDPYVRDKYLELWENAQHRDEE